MARKFSRKLQEQLHLADTSWNYTVLNLPNKNDCETGGYIKTCGLVGSASGQGLYLTYTKIPQNRAIAGHPLDKFIHFTCANFRLHTKDGQSTTFRESADYISRLLKAGIILNGTLYSFYGHSNSQLKSRSCFLMAGSSPEVDTVVEALGDFSTMKTVAKKAKRIGLLFSTAHAVVDVDPRRCRDVEDIERDSYIFTDGCGSISTKLARLLTQKKPILFRNRRYHPSVFQIRYRGYKGVVVLEPKLQKEIQLEFRKSMRKFSGGSDNSFAVVDYSKPFTYGYLNDETVLLLSALGIQQDILARKQLNYFEFLQSACTNATVAFRFLSSIGNIELAEKVLLNGLEDVQRQVRKRVADEYAKFLNKRGEHKCRILIPRSRLLFGICDPYDVLKENECFVKPTADDDGVPHALCGTNVLVARNPCLHPGDLRKLRAVAPQELAHLVDCIVFSTRGRRPAADMMSGGDLDGDQFFVTWDEEVIPSSVSQAAEYPGGRESIQFTRITSHDRIDYFARSSSMQLGQIKNLYLRWAYLKGPLSSECQELNRLFSQCVDASRIKIPDRLEKLPDCGSPDQPPFILDSLHDLAQDHLRSHPLSFVVDKSMAVDDLLNILVESNSMSQFELVQLTYSWCQKSGSNFSDLWRFFDYTSMSTEERAWVSSLLPPTLLTLGMVNNDLLHSSILSHDELETVHLRYIPVRWRCVFRSDEDRVANLLETMHRTFPLFTRKLLVLDIHDRLSVAVYFPKAIMPSDPFPLENSGRVFAFPHQKGQVQDSRVVVPTKHNTRFVYHNGGFQLYEGAKGNTFIFFTRSQNDESRYSNTPGRGNRARLREQTIQEGINHEWRTSIALGKFSHNLQRHVGRLLREGVAGAELYVIANRDTRSMRNLDLWLQQIDTEKVHLNFEYEHELEPFIRRHDWATETQTVRSIGMEGSLHLLSTSASCDDVARVLNIAWDTYNTELVTDLFSIWRQRLSQMTVVEPRDELIQTRMVDFLTRMPSLTVHFINLCPWSHLAAETQSLLAKGVFKMTKALLLCANTIGEIISDKLKTLLEEIPSLDMEQLGEIFELVALTVETPETALDIFLGALEPMATRLLLGSPIYSHYFTKLLGAIALDHIEEAHDNVRSGRGTNFQWHFDRNIHRDGDSLFLECAYRIDAPQAIRLKAGDHVRFRTIEPPTNVVLAKPAFFEAVVERSTTGEVFLRCLRHPPPFFQKCLWKADNCGSFVTNQTMIDAIVKLAIQKEECCSIYSQLFQSSRHNMNTSASPSIRTDLSRLNESQRQAVAEALTGPLTCIWGPPGTGKTHTIVSIINELARSGKDSRILVTAPTHNAVDNVMRQFLRHADNGMISRLGVLRVSTDVHKVGKDLRSHTCDAMLGKDLNQFPAARKKAQEQIRRSRLVFSTCIGTGLGLIRNELFNDVVIDEASQQSEPASLVPLIKGARRVILVGDHVQLRPTVQPNAQALEFDISLFERLWTESSKGEDGSPVRRVMLNTQYRMHPDLCAFPSSTFYEGNLRTADQCQNIKVPKSGFVWPDSSSHMVFIQSSSAEDRGHRSKSNGGQVKICEEIVKRLRLTAQEQQTATEYSVAILTPYTRQAELLRSHIPSETISSIDGYQGQEADVIVYVTVRCNPHREIGFLRDMRRLNVALTRAKAALIIVGDEATLTAKGKVLEEGEELEDCFHIWRGLIGSMDKVQWDEVSES